MGGRKATFNKTHWYFLQGPLGFRTQYLRVPIGTGRATTRKISVSNSCRENLISLIRHSLSAHLRERRLPPAPRRRPGSHWAHPSYIWEQVAKADLEQESVRQPYSTCLTVSKSHLQNVYIYDWSSRPYCSSIKSPSQGSIKQVIEIADAILGTVCVLMSPNRATGDWWMTLPNEREKSGQIMYYGIDNCFLYHPALVSLACGLLRQAALLARAGEAKNIIRIAPRQEVVKALTDSDPELALHLVKRLRPWIEVPSPKHGLKNNIPIPKGHWGRLMALHKAIYKHGYERAFGSGFETSWGLNSTTTPYGTRFNGIGSYLGARKGSIHTKHLMKMARKSSA